MHLECKRCVELFDVSDVMSLASYVFADSAGYCGLVCARLRLCLRFRLLGLISLVELMGVPGS